MAEASPRPKARVFRYRALYAYDPKSQGVEEEDYIELEEGDEIEVLDSGVKVENGWLQGKNCRTNQFGYFPENYVEKIAKLRPTKPKPVMRKIRDEEEGHKLQPVYFVRPVLCSLCSDYIWGSGLVGKQCSGCKQCYHCECELVLQNSATTANVCQKQDHSELLTVYQEPVPLEAWQTENIMEWMSVVNLGRYTQIFKRQTVCGDNIHLLTRDVLAEMLIKDSFHKDAILACTSALQDWENSVLDSAILKEEGAKASDHHLIIYCFSSVQYCHICGRVLWGLWHQGYQCRACGLRCHRKCIVCRLPACNPDHTGVHCIEDGLFVLDLNDDGKASPIVERCTVELETKAIQYSQHDSRVSPLKLILDAYRLPVPTHDIERLKKAFSTSGDIRGLDLGEYDLPCIAGVLKKYLRELPASVIPQNFYHQLIIESKRADDELGREGMRVLIGQLPSNHALTLERIMTHLANICRMSNSSSETPVKLAQVFCHILIRPPWESIMETANNMDDHYRAVLRILKCQDWGGQTISSTLPPPPTVVPRSRAVEGVGRTRPAVSNPPTNLLEEADWYWGDAKKETITERMAGMPDGTFVVRNAGDISLGAAYTLTVRMGGSNLLLRIYDGDGVGFKQTENEFSSLFELIDFYKKHSLASFSSKLDTVLRIPLSKSMGEEPGDGGSQLLDEKHFVRTHFDFMTNTEYYNHMQDQLSHITEDMQTKQLYLMAAKETCTMLSDHLAISAKSKELLMRDDRNKMERNVEMIRSRLEKSERMVGDLEDEISKASIESRNLHNSLNTTNRRINDLQKSHESLKIKLLDHGCSPAKLEQVIELTNQWLKEQGSDADSFSQLWSYLDTKILHAPSLPHLDSRNWHSPSFGREQAEIFLMDKPEGTFLIRPSREGLGSLALSIVCKAEPLLIDKFAGAIAPLSDSHTDLTVVHCRIEHTETGYGFAEPYIIHETLTDLVLHYKDTSLVEHNDSLDVTLNYPAFANNYIPSSAASNGNSLPLQTYIYHQL